ncbi:hypothetical protein [Lacticaseibacillus parakribbianus]|uniref:hypothetical protein n=1 Tax=Lacticaseibacillus parakribbianus TaxID=2970927 RepID=UPI0021CB7241|nr:hypothetical protein [Lacticaseibacillus parakribbianus]
MKADKHMDQEAIIDMNEQLVDYAGKHGLAVPDLAQALAQAATPALTGLDALLKDGGVGRKIYEDVAQGYLVDRYHLAGSELEAAHKKLIEAAVGYLGQHTAQLDNWQR